MAAKPRTGWIIEIVSGIHLIDVGRTFYRMGHGDYATLFLVNTHVIATRKRARQLAFSNFTEVVRKVELDELGRATHIIPGR